VSVVIVGVIRRKPVLTHASIVCEGMLASVNSVKNSLSTTRHHKNKRFCHYTTQLMHGTTIIKKNSEKILYSSFVYQSQGRHLFTFCSQKV